MKESKRNLQGNERESREKETNGELPNQGSESQKETQASRRCLFLIQKKEEKNRKSKMKR